MAKVRVFKTAAALQEHLITARQAGQSTGFVPTMGALHQGHLSLIQASRGQADLTVCSIFVNPAQFNDPSDYDKYPVTLDRDMELLEEAGADALFLPAVQEIYPQGLKNLEHYDLGYLETILEGEYRPGHFQGVCQVMSRLLRLVQPDHLFMGQKDYQQCMVVKKLLELMHMEERIQLHISPTLREPDGLAMSSRNLRIPPDKRPQAVVISAALRYVKEQLAPGSTERYRAHAHDMIAGNGLNVDYLEIADADTLQTVTQWDGHQKLVTLAAAYLDDVRLIDNMTIN